MLAHAGVEGPDGRPLSEAMVFGIAGGIGIGVFQFYYEKADQASFFLAGRHSWHDDVPYAVNTFNEFALAAVVKESAGAKAAEKNLREALAGGTPCMAWVDAAHLPHRALPVAFSGGGYHIITVYGIDDDAGVAWIGDCTDNPLKISLSDLAEARARIKKYTNRVLWLMDPGSAKRLSEKELERLVRAGLARCWKLLETPAMKSSASNFQLAAIERWAKRLHGSVRKDSWETVFKPGAKLWRGLTWIYDTIEHYGTGGGLCRLHMADFLAEAAKALGDSKLGEVAETYRELGRSWSELARAALPENVPEMQQARQLLADKSELVHEGAPSSRVRELWDELQKLETRVGKRFPLSEAASGELRAALKERVLAIHAGEVAALEDLQRASA